MENYDAARTLYENTVRGTIEQRLIMYEARKPLRSADLPRTGNTLTPHPITNFSHEGHILIDAACRPDHFLVRYHNALKKNSPRADGKYRNPATHTRQYETIVKYTLDHGKTDISDILEDPLFHKLKSLPEKDLSSEKDVKELTDTSTSVASLMRDRITENIVNNISLSGEIIKPGEEREAQNNRTNATAKRVKEGIQSLQTWVGVDADGNNKNSMHLVFPSDAAVIGKTLSEISSIDKIDASAPRFEPRISSEAEDKGKGKMPGALDYMKVQQRMAGLGERPFGIDDVTEGFEARYKQYKSQLQRMTYEEYRTAREGETVDEVAQKTMLDYALRTGAKNGMSSVVFSNFPSGREGVDLLMSLHFHKKALTRYFHEEAEQNPKDSDQFKQIAENMGRQTFYALTESQEAIEGFKGVIGSYLDTIEQQKSDVRSTFGRMENGTFISDTGFFAGPSDLGADEGPFAEHDLCRTMEDMAKLQNTRFKDVFKVQKAFIPVSYGQGTSDNRGASLTLRGGPDGGPRYATRQGATVDPLRLKDNRVPARVRTYEPSPKFRQDSIDHFHDLWHKSNGMLTKGLNGGIAPDLLSNEIANNRGGRAKAGVEPYGKHRAIGKSLLRTASGFMPMPLFSPTIKDGKTTVDINPQDFREMLQCPLWSKMILQQLKQVGMNFDPKVAQLMGFPEETINKQKAYVAALTKTFAQPELLNVPKFAAKGADASNVKELEEYVQEALSAARTMKDRSGNVVLAPEADSGTYTIAKAVAGYGENIRPHAVKVLEDYVQSGKQDTKSARAYAFALSMLGEGNGALPFLQGVSVAPSSQNKPPQRLAEVAIR